MAVSRFNVRSFLVRWGIALILVLATFNPTEYSFYHWVGNVESGSWPLKALAGIALVILYIIYLRATWRSIGPFGLALAIGFFGVVIWLLVDVGLLDPGQTVVMTYVVLIVIATVMAVGISWSHIRRRVSGQADMDDVDE